MYATHGHYLDLHLTIPRLESIAASAMGRLTKLGHDARSAADYETILAPLYAFYAGLAQGASAARARPRQQLLAHRVAARQRRPRGRTPRPTGYAGHRASAPPRPPPASCSAASPSRAPWRR